MLRSLTVCFIGVCAAIAIAACSNVSSTSGLSIGPSFPVGSLYVTNATQNLISIYKVNQSSGSGPAYSIGGSSTSLNNPQYLAFDSSNNLWVTNYNASTQAGNLIEIHSLATGNVLPIGIIASNSTNGIVRPRGIAINGADKEVVIANVNPTAGSPFESQLLLFSTDAASVDNSVPELVIAGPLTLMNVPSGVALSGRTAYVTNLQAASVEAFAVPSYSPSPTPTPPTPSPSPTPTAPTPTPSPTPTPVNIAPSLVLSGALTGITQPTDVALDSSGNLYISDAGSLAVSPSVLVFPAGLSGTVNQAPTRKISGSNTKLFAPTGIAVDASGNIYVADTTAAGAGMIYVFSATANGNVAPMTTYTSPGVPVGLGLVP